MESNLFRSRDGSKGLRLWPVGTVLALAFVSAVLVAATVFLLGWDMLAVQSLKPERRLSSETLFDLVKVSFGVVAGAGALVALIVAYRRQRVDEDGAQRDATRLHTERFTTAVSQLGEEPAAVRLGGVHAIAGLADDAPTRELRQTCIDVLCAYLRLPYTAERDLPEGDAEARHSYLSRREVRHTTIRLIRDHFRLAPEHPRSWQGHDLDFTGVVFDGGDFSGARFSQGSVSFDQATFSGGAVTFDQAEFSGSKVSFGGAEFSGGSVSFGEAGFRGSPVSFHLAKFSGSSVSFGEAEFSGGSVDFLLSVFSHGRVGFPRAVFSGAAVNFDAAVFSGTSVGFDDARFAAGHVSFDHATFDSGQVRFPIASFSGASVNFDAAIFAADSVSFEYARFSRGSVSFSGARFSRGSVSFPEAMFRGTAIDFSDIDGPLPAGIAPSDEENLPPGVTLPGHRLSPDENTG